MTGTALAATISFLARAEKRRRRRAGVAAPSNLGLRPLRADHVPGGWRASGIAKIVRKAPAPARGHKLPLWLHVDLDVLDGTLLPAVGSPGSPDFPFEERGEIIRRFPSSGRTSGPDLALCDPDLNPTGKHTPERVRCFGAAFAAGRM